MLDRFFASLPKGVIGVLGVVGGLLFLVMWDPPKTVCDIQLEIFRKNQNKFLYKRTKKGIDFNPEFEKFIAKCAYSNSMGGCFEFFGKLRALNRDLKAMPSECQSRMRSEGDVKKYLLMTLKFMIELAWGDRPPVSYSSRNGWFQGSEIALFCKVKDQVIRLIGKRDWELLRDGMFKELPGAAELDRGTVWNRSIMSTRCEAYR